MKTLILFMGLMTSAIACPEKPFEAEATSVLCESARERAIEEATEKCIREFSQEECRIQGSALLGKTVSNCRIKVIMKGRADCPAD